MTKFTPDWEPNQISEEIVGSGVWWYQNKVPYKAELIKQKYDYTSKDIALLDDMLGVPNIDYIHYEISDDGVLYFWKFTCGEKQHFSKTFGSYGSARKHIESYEGICEIEWVT